MKRSLLLLPACLTLTGLTLAADWPAWRGPDRTGVSKEKGLLATWPAAGPKLLWTQEETGIGYAGPAVVGDRLFIMGGDGRKDYLYALDVKTGKKAWAAEVGAFYDNDWGGGPRSTPTVDGDLLYLLGPNGDLVCLNRDTGKRVWSVSLTGDLGGNVPNWGYTESPLVDGDLVIVTPGGGKGTLAALDKKTGKLAWRSGDWTDEADYASVVVSNAQKTRQYVQMAGASVGGVDAKTGKLLWRFPREHRITIPTPITFDNFVYVTSGYGVGCNLLELTSKTEYREVYANNNMENHHGGVILLYGHLYGHSDSRGWVCQKASDGEVVWRHNKFPKGSIAHADGHFYCYAQTDGTLARIQATTAGWRENGRFKIPHTSKSGREYRNRANIWTHPVIANGRLYLRDQEYLFCYDVKGATP
jgi:outer membrane protein assembly factor BamB